MTYKPALRSAIVFAIIAVILGAFGAHALKLEGSLQNSYETAVKYQFYHSFALIFAGLLYHFYPSPWIKRATWAFVLGILLFSGSIYLLVYLKTTASIGLGGLGIVTPIGGLSFILGWICLLLSLSPAKVGKA